MSRSTEVLTMCLGHAILARNAAAADNSIGCSHLSLDSPYNDCSYDNHKEEDDDAAKCGLAWVYLHTETTDIVAIARLGSIGSTRGFPRDRLDAQFV